MGFQAMPSLCDLAHDGVLRILGIDQPRSEQVVWSVRACGMDHRVHLGVEEKQGECICPIS
jgi:hypothetical protein